MDDTPSFGYWIRRRRKALDLTQEELAQRVGCSLGAIRKLEADERRPSPEMAERLAALLELADQDRVAFLKVARAERATDQLVSPTASVDMSSRSSRDGQGTFPVATTPLIGRGAEVATVRAALEQPGVRLLTLTGPGGTGKTRLAIAVASAMQDDVASGAAFVDLAPIREPNLVLVTIAATLGIAERPEQSLLASLQDTMREKQFLLVLDNFEQVVSAAPELATLLRVAPGLRLLVTSRIVLAVSGEHVLAIPPLELPDPVRLPHVAELMEVAAIQLFVERARAADSTFVFAEANAQAVVDICRRLDGLPLAIELAAARTRVLSPAALLLRLEQRLRVLTGGARDLPARQQTLRATIDWSYDLLTEDEQRLFRRLAVFAGGWTLEAVEAVCADNGVLGMEVVDQLQTLLENSLILKTEGPDGARRFRMLETLHEYALAHLEDSGEAIAVRQQHTAYFLQLAETVAPHLTTAEWDPWLERLEAEHDNLRAALAWCEAQADQGETMLRLTTALVDFWWKHLSEGVDWAHRALRCSVPPLATAEGSRSELMRLRARALLAAAGLARMWGDYALASSDAEESIALYEALGDQAGLADALGLAGNSAVDAEIGMALMERSAALYRSLGDTSNLSILLINLGRTARVQGNYAKSEVFYTEALELLRLMHDEQWLSSVLENMGALALQQRAPERAVSLLEESVGLSRGQQLPWTNLNLGWALIHLAEARRVAGGTADGAGSSSSEGTSITALWEEGLALLRASEVRHIIAVALLQIGETVYEQGDDARSAELLRESVALHHEVGWRDGVGYGLDAIAGVWAEGRTLEAIRRAVQLWSAATKWHENVARHSPVQRSRYEQTFAAARSQLDEAAFAVAWAEGQAMTLEQAIACALEATHPE